MCLFLAMGRKFLALLLHRTVCRRGILFTIYASMELQPLPVVAPVSLAYDFQYRSIKSKFEICQIKKSMHNKRYRSRFRLRVDNRLKTYSPHLTQFTIVFIEKATRCYIIVGRLIR